MKALLSDNPIVCIQNDSFSWTPYAESLADFVAESSDLPLSLGIYGSWGAGKTTFMHFMEHFLKDKYGSKIKTIWVHPWKYNNTKEIQSAVIHSVLFELAKETQNPQIRQILMDLAKSFTFFALRKGISTISTEGISDTAVDTLVESINKNNQKMHQYINSFENDFNKVVKEFVGEGMLVIIVDDIDRCLPENIVPVFESLKLFLSNDRCTFICGMDYDIVRKGVSLYYSNRDHVSSGDYLDKIIQIPFNLPPVTVEDLKDAVGEDRRQHLDDKAWHLIQSGFNLNPRQTKRFVLLYDLLTRMMENCAVKVQANNPPFQLNEETTFYFLKILVFQIQFPDFYLVLRAEPAAWQVFEEDILNAVSVDEREKVFNREGYLRKFFDNKQFMNFMVVTGRAGTFPPPSSSIVSKIMHLTNITFSDPTRE